MNREVRIRLWMAVALVFACTARLGTAQAPPPIERAPELGSDRGSNGIQAIGLIPGLPLGPYKLSPAASAVGFIDSGVQADHPQLNGLVVAARDFTGEGLQDDFHHGTIVALMFLKGFFNTQDSLDAGATKSPEGIISAKVVGKKIVSDRITAQRMVAAIQWLKQQNVKIINISLALPGKYSDFSPLCQAISTQKGVLFVIAAGNGGPSEVVYPANCGAANAMVVGSVDSSGQIAPYSGRGAIFTSGDVSIVPLFEYYRLEGDRLAREEKYDEAQAAYAHALDSSPPPEGLAKIKYGLGFVTSKQNRPEEALQDFLAAIAGAPQFAEAYVAASLILTGRGDFQAASTLLQRGIAAGAGTPRVRDRLARALMDLDRPKEALEQIDVLRHLDPKIEGLEELALGAHNWIAILNRLEKGEDPQQLFWTTLEVGDGDIVGFLTRHAKVDVDIIPEGTQAPPIVRAAAKKQHGVVAALLRARAKVDASNPSNRITALMAASNAGDATLVRVLLKEGASVDLTDDFGFTALMFAAEQGRLQCAESLLESGADPSPKSQEAKTALDYATEHGYRDISEALDRAMKNRPKVP